MKNISLRAGEGEMVALVGRNGTGKSTLLRSILGLLPLLEGDCLLSGVELGQMDASKRAKAVSYVSSQVSGLPSLTVRELVSLGRMPHTGWMGKMKREDLALVEEIIDEVGMKFYMDRSLDQLSDGERQRVMIARALVQDTPHIILDEPAAYLDIPNKYELVRLLSLFRDRGKTIIYSTHDLETALMCADKFWVISEGSIHEGSPEDLGLAGLFHKLFNSSGINFDLKSGRFTYTGLSRGELHLSGGSEEEQAWTMHALQRIGYRAVKGPCSLNVKILSSPENQWLIQKEGKDTRVDSIHKLARYLIQDV